MKREESTPEQLEAAIVGGLGLDPCRYYYAKEVWPDASGDTRWHLRIPPHAVIHALRRDRDTYASLLTSERKARQDAEKALAELRAAIAHLLEPLYASTLFDEVAS